MAGCASTGYNKSDAAARSLQRAGAEVQSENLALETTMATLNDLINRPGVDLRPQFRSYTVALDRLVSSAERTQHTGREMQSRSAEYFEAWNKELAAMNFEHIRKHSENRKAEVISQFNTIDERYQQTQEAMQPLIAYLEDIRRALESDLTMPGLAAVKGITSNAEENAGKVRTALAGLSADLTASGSQMSPYAWQAATNESRPATNAAPVVVKPPPTETSSR